VVTRAKSSLVCKKEQIAVARWKDRGGTFRYNYVGDLVARLIASINFPLQLELHPGSQCGSLRCSYCYSRKQELCEGLMTIDQYSQLFDDLMDNPPFIEISGIGSDPLSYPYFCALLRLIRRKGLSFGIHTKGILLNKELIELLNSENSEGSYITIGVDSANANTYNRLHGLAPNNGLYNKVRENIISLYTEKLRRQSGLKINLAYLLFANNSSKKDIDEFIETFEDYADVIRFSIPQVANVAKSINYLDRKQTDRVLRLLEKYENDRITVLNFKESKHDEAFEVCWAQRFNATIDKAGNVFPCPQVALKDYLGLSWGNITEHRFWDIWNSDKRKKMHGMSVTDMECRVCDRKDESINVELTNLMNIDRFVLSTPLKK
jgi:radical SAM protein with 4Fe4S-binding SPASM domain